MGMVTFIIGLIISLIALGWMLARFSSSAHPWLGLIIFLIIDIPILIWLWFT